MTFARDPLEDTGPVAGSPPLPRADLDDLQGGARHLDGHAQSVREGLGHPRRERARVQVRHRGLHLRHVLAMSATLLGSV